VIGLSRQIAILVIVNDNRILCQSSACGQSEIKDHRPTLTVFIIGLSVNSGGRCLRGRILKERPFRDILKQASQRSRREVWRSRRWTPGRLDGRVEGMRAGRVSGGVFIGERSFCSEGSSSSLLSSPSTSSASKDTLDTIDVISKYSKYLEAAEHRLTVGSDWG
jgi:hypothetical protein